MSKKIPEKKFFRSKKQVVSLDMEPCRRSRPIDRFVSFDTVRYHTFYKRRNIFRSGRAYPHTCNVHMGRLRLPFRVI